MAMIRINYEINYETDCDITIDSKWNWIPSYEEAKEMTDNWTCHRQLFGGWESKVKFAEWYLTEVRALDEELMDFIDKVSLADWLLDEFTDCLMELRTGAIIQFDVGLWEV